MRSALRTATAAVHERLHEAPPFAAISQQRLNLAGYSNLLRTIAAFHFTVGPHLQSDGSRRRLLANDLDYLGAPSPPTIHWTPPPTSAARLGCAYVVEGSCLGGKLIYRQLNYLFGESVRGRSFFKGLASDGAHWRALCRRLETEGRARGALDEMAEAAEQTFALLEQLIEPARANG